MEAKSLAKESKKGTSAPHMENTNFQNEMNVTAISPTTAQLSKDGLTSAKSSVINLPALSRNRHL